MEEKKEIPVNLEKLMYYPPSKGYALILKEDYPDKKGTRHLPIIVGVYEAQAIALGLEKLNMPRPMTHDLFTKFIKQLNYDVDKIVVNDLKEGTFYADIYFVTDENEKYTVDARPSDAIALALRMEASIFVVEKVMKEAGKIEETSSKALKDYEPHNSEAAQSEELDKLFDLQMKLQKAIDDENYERAAELRDKINELESQKDSDSPTEEN